MTGIVKCKNFAEEYYSTLNIFPNIITMKLGKATSKIHHVPPIRDETEQNLKRRPLNPVQVTTKPPTLKKCMQYKQHKNTL